MKRDDRTWARSFFKDTLAAGTFEDWLAFVSEIEVDLRPNGRALLGHPDLDATVEIRWDAEGVNSLCVSPRQGGTLPRTEVEASTCIAALELRRRAVAIDPASVSGVIAQTLPSLTQALNAKVVSPPAAGRPPALDWYRKILAEYDDLVSHEVKAPVDELARRYHRSPNTVKTWRRRGQKLKREGKLE